MWKYLLGGWEVRCRQSSFLRGFWARVWGWEGPGQDVSSPQAIADLGRVAPGGPACSEMEFLGQDKENRCLRDEAKSR